MDKRSWLGFCLKGFLKDRHKYSLQSRFQIERGCNRMFQRLSLNNQCSSSKSRLSVILSVIVFLLVAANFRVYAVYSNWVVLNSIQDLTDNVTLQANQPLTAGHGYNVTVTVDVPFTQTQSEFQVALNPSMSQQSTQYWYLLSNYAGYNGSKFTAGLPSISFDQVQGQVMLSVLFSVPQGFTTTQAGNLNLHFLKDNVNVVTIAVTGGAMVGNLQRQFSDEAIQRYLTAYSQKSTLIPQLKIDSTYTGLVNGILDQARAVYQLGLPDNALTILDIINPTSFPPPPDNMLNMVLIVLVVAMVVGATLVAVMYMRANSKLGVMSNTVADVQRDLAALEVSAGQFDRKLADKVKALKERLGESI